MEAPTKRTFEECIEIIDREILKRRNRWSLDSIASIDYDDVSQILRTHIYKKWHLYNEKFCLEPWLNAVISSQMKNLIRNLYGNYSRPCLRCDAAQDETGCKIYHSQCNKCPLYAEWERRKLPAYNIKLPVTIENHIDEVNNLADNSNDISDQVFKIHEKMKELLSIEEYKVYEGLFILNEDDEEIAIKLNCNDKIISHKIKYFNGVKKRVVSKLKNTYKKGEIKIEKS